MPQLLYTPQALEDLQQIRTNLRSQFGAETAKKRMRHLTQTLRNLESFPKMGFRLEKEVLFPTDYFCLFIQPNYVFYRIDTDAIYIIRILNQRQDFMRILFSADKESLSENIQGDI